MKGICGSLGVSHRDALQLPGLLNWGMQMKTVLILSALMLQGCAALGHVVAGGATGLGAGMQGYPAVYGPAYQPAPRAMSCSSYVLGSNLYTDCR